MKLFTHILFFFLLVTQICFAQWYQQNSGTTHRLTSVSFTDQNNGTVVGEYGTILRTTDGGTNWFSQMSDTLNWFNGVSFTDANTGTVVGFGKILRTTDGGTTWTFQTSPAFSNFWSVCFTDANNGTAVGSGGIIVRTTNGGTTWTLQTSGVTEWLNGVSFTDPYNGTAVGDYGTILRTTNGGLNWVIQAYGSWYNLWGVSFTDANNGTVVSYGDKIFRTSNGGATWTLQTSGTYNALYGGVSFTDINNGTAVGEYGTILRTTDGGTTWTVQTSGTSNDLYGVSFTDSNTGTAVGDYGTILRTINGGIPVALTSFTAISNRKEVILSWSTATETNNRGFEIERQVSSKEYIVDSRWEKIGFVLGFGTTTEPKSYSYSDQSVKSGTYYYRLKQVDYDGSYEYSDVVEVELRAINSYLLEQNYPNPFNPSTTIGFGIQSKSNVKITVLNVIGEEVAVILNEEREPGYYQVEFNARSLASGVYFYRMKAQDFIQTRKMLLIR